MNDATEYTSSIHYGEHGRRVTGPTILVNMSSDYPTPGAELYINIWFQNELYELASNHPLCEVDKYDWPDPSATPGLRKEVLSGRVARIRVNVDDHYVDAEVPEGITLGEIIRQFESPEGFTTRVPVFLSAY